MRTFLFTKTKVLLALALMCCHMICGGELVHVKIVLRIKLYLKALILV